METLSSRVRRVLRLRRVTANDLSLAAGLHCGYVSALTSGRRERLWAAEAVALCRASGVRVEWLITGEGAMEAPLDATHQVAGGPKPNLDLCLSRLPGRRWESRTIATARGMVGDPSPSQWMNILDELEGALPPR